MKRQGYCIFIHALFEGSVPSVRNETGMPFVFATERAAQREIADNAIVRLQEFINGEREFDDAFTLEEYVVRVEALSDGSVVDEFGINHGTHRLT